MIIKARKDLFVTIAVLFFFSLTTKAQKKEISFEKQLNWNQVKNKAKAENKYIFVDIYGTWCSSCKWMDDNVYNSMKVEQFMSDKFISIKVQQDTSKTDSEETKKWYADASQMMKQYKIVSLPTFLFFSPDGKVVHKFSGVVADTTFIKIAGNALDPNKQYYTILNKYNAGKLSYDKMASLARSANQIGEMDIAIEAGNDYIDNYLLKLKDSLLFSKANLTILFQFVSVLNTKSKGFRFISDHKKRINEIVGENAAEIVIKRIIGRDYIPEEATWGTKQLDWDALEQKVKKKFGSLGQEEVFGQRMWYYLSLRDHNNFDKYFVLYFEMALKRSIYDINNLAWAIFERSNNPKVLDFACNTVMKYAIETRDQNDFAAYDTYANLLYKIGQKEQAVEWEQKAAKLSNNAKEIVETLEKMKKGEKTWK